jgi:hypothetical protein
VDPTRRDPVTIRVDGDVSGQFVVGNGNTVSGSPRPDVVRRPAPVGGTRVFVSYVREDLVLVDRLVAALRDAGYDVWTDRGNLLPGMRWQQEIRKAIESGDYFLACFSPRYWKPLSYMNEELALAVARLRLMPRTRSWFIPVVLERCELPDFPIGPGETIADSIQYADFAADWETALRQLIAAIGPAKRA